MFIKHTKCPYDIPKLSKHGLPKHTKIGIFSK
jgi:hypothetical protein